MRSLDYRVDLGVLSMDEVMARLKVIANIWFFLMIRYSQWFKRYKDEWHKEGDTHSGFFNARVKTRSRRNAILTLKFISNQFKERLNDCS